MKNILTNSHKISLGLYLLMLILLALGCNFLDRQLKVNYFESDAAQVAAQAFKEKIGKPFKVFEIIITSEGFTIHAQNLNNLRNLDEYQYVAGFVIGPTPVQLRSAHGNLEQTTFPFDEINFAAVPTIVQESVSKAGLEGGRVGKMTFQRLLAKSETGSSGNFGDGRWFIEIEGTRESATARADPNGKLLGVDLSRTSQAADYSVFKNGELQKAQDALKNSLGADAKIQGITIYEKYVFVEVLNPQNPNKLDIYNFDINGLTKSVLRQTSARNRRDTESFALGEVNLPEALNFVEKAKSKLKMPNGTIELISIHREKSSVANKGFRTIWSLSFKSGAADGSVDYDNNGAEISVSKR